MRKFLLFCVLFSGLRLTSQNVNLAEHDTATYAIENILNINSKCFYVERNLVKYCCNDQLKITAINSAGQTIFSNSFHISGWNYTKKLVKTNDQCLLLLGYGWHSCEGGSYKGSILKIDTNGVILFQTAIQTTTASTSIYTGQMVDVTQHPDSSYYAVSATHLFHYSKTGQFVSYTNTGFSGINSIKALSNGHLLINSAAYNTEVTTTNSIVLQQPATNGIIKFIQTTTGILYGLTGLGVIEKYSQVLTQTASSSVLTPSNFKITHFIERNDSLFVTGTELNSNAPFYRILDQNFNVLYQTQSTYKNVIPKGIAINNNKINIITEGTSATSTEVNFKSLYQFPVTGSFISSADIGITKLSVITHTFSFYTFPSSSPVLFPSFNLSFTVKNYGNVPVSSFYVNYSKLACDWMFFHKLYNVVILPGDSVILQTGDFQAQPSSVTALTQGNNVFNYTVCLFTTIPNASNDTEINNDAYCSSINIAGIYTGLDQPGLNSTDINLFPNPFNTTLQVQSDAMIRQVSIYNTLSVQQREISVNKNEIALDLADLPAGIYFIKLQTDRGSVIKKVVKE